MTTYVQRLALHRGTLLACLMLGAGTFSRPAAAEIVLDRLECIRTEDSGRDECHLDVYADGTRVSRQRFSMSEGGTRRLAQTVRAQREVRVVLKEEDTPDGDDSLGTVVIRASSEGIQSQMFTGDGARYRLHYRGGDPARDLRAAATYRLKLDRLECLATEDAAIDECLLRFKVDGGDWRGDRQRNMSVSGLWILGSEHENAYDYEFRQGVRVRLIDRDIENMFDFGGHDVLGEIFIPPHETRTRSVHFKRYGAHYRLWYSVILSPER